MTTGKKWSIVGIIGVILIFILCVVPLKTEAYTVKELYTVTETYIEKQPYEATEEYTVNVPYTYTAPCTETGPSYGYECCRPPGSPGGIAPYPSLGDPAYNPYAYRPVVRYCEYTGTRPEARTRIITKVRNVSKTRTVPQVRDVVKYRKVAIISCAPLPS